MIFRRPALNFQSRPERVTCTFAMRHFHEPAGSDDFNDPGGWNKASYTPDYLAEIGEPLPDVPTIIALRPFTICGLCMPLIGF
jgi:hypothetical protein